MPKERTEDDPSNFKQVKYPICKKWKNDASSLSFIGAVVRATSFLVVLVNFVLRKLFITLIGCAGENKKSKEASASMFSVLVVSFFNYGILYIIGPWNFVEWNAQEGTFFSGIYTDFTAQWFLDIGGLIAQTTALNIVFPLVEFLLFWFIRHVKRMLD